MPFAGYKDFGDCMAKLAKKYPKKETRQKVCGSLQAKHETKKHELETLKQEIAKEKEFLKSIGKGLKIIKEEIK